MSLKRLVIKKKKEELDVVEIPEERLVNVEGTTNVYADRQSSVVVVRCTGNFANKAFCLYSDFDWKIGIDDKGVVCLVPLKKGGVEKDDL